MPQAWIIKGRRAEDEMFRAMWERAMDDMIARLVFKNKVSGLTYVASLSPCGRLCSPSPSPGLPCCLLCNKLRRVMLKS